MRLSAFIILEVQIVLLLSTGVMKANALANNACLIVKQTSF
jgi:hypothetical protein